MQKGIVIILAVAIIGALGVYGKSQAHNSSNSASSSTPNSSTSSSSANTLGDSTPGSSIGLKDGTYTGQTEQTAYGPVQIAVIVSGGKITDVTFLQMPDDRGHTQEVTAFAEPLLKQETIGKTNAHIDFVTGATQTSESYQQSLQSALDQAA
ncbi:MAG TPA: FMN-binding protein [Candidatus Babeliales bacterium]|nr:FMN-binding protein [Candidatus Babeliales bacterium]